MGSKAGLVGKSGVFRGVQNINMDAKGRLAIPSRQRERLLSAAWRESIGHSKPSKSKALPLDEAKARAAQLETELGLRYDLSEQWDLSVSYQRLKRTLEHPELYNDVTYNAVTFAVGHSF